MNEIVNMNLLRKDKFLPEVHLKKFEFTYSTCGTFSKTRAEYKNLKKQKIQDIFLKNN